MDIVFERCAAREASPRRAWLPASAYRAESRSVRFLRLFTSLWLRSHVGGT